MALLFGNLCEWDLLCGHRDCKYAVMLGNSPSCTVCDYLAIEGHKRPCKPTTKCKCYEKGKHKKAKTVDYSDVYELYEYDEREV